MELILASHWYILLGSVLLLPLLSPSAMAGMLPALVIYGLSNNDQLREYATYYSAPIIPFLFFGFVRGGRRLMDGVARDSATYAGLGVALACGVFALSGGGYQKFPTVYRQPLKDLSEARRFLELQNPKLVCSQTLLFPHLPYHWRMQPLSPECLEQSAAWTVILNNPQYDSYPLGAKELRDLVEGQAHARLIRSYPSGLEIYQTL